MRICSKCFHLVLLFLKVVRYNGDRCLVVFFLRCVSSCTMYKVAIVGHSQVPVDLPEIPYVELKIFRKPGANLEDIHETPLGDVFNFRPDLCIVLMGGNDIGIPQADRSEVMGKLHAYLLELKEITPDLRWMNMEKRFYPFRNRYGLNNQQHEVDRKWFNTAMRRFLRTHQIQPLNVTGPWWADNQTNSIHFNQVAKESIKRKLLNCILQVVTHMRRFPDGTVSDRLSRPDSPVMAGQKRRRR